MIYAESGPAKLQALHIEELCIQFTSRGSKQEIRSPRILDEVADKARLLAEYPRLSLKALGLLQRRGLGTRLPRVLVSRGSGC